MKTLTVKVPDALFTEISHAALIRKIPRSEIARERLAQKSAKSKAAKASLWSQMEDLVIQSDTLPVDLSSNKAHLKSYGKKRSHH